MKEFKYCRNLFVFLTTFFILITSGCRDKSSDQIDSNTPGVDVSLQDEPNGRRPPDIFTDTVDDANEVAVTVNGVDILEGEIQEIIDPEFDAIANSPEAAMLPPGSLMEYKKQMRESILQQLIVKRLLDPEIKAENIVVTEEDAKELIMQQLSSQPQPMSLDDFKNTLKEYGKNYDEEVQRIKNELVYQKFLDAKMSEQAEVTEEDAQKFYDENPKQFELPEQVRASHILVQTKQDDPNDVRQNAKEKIDDLLRQVNEGADFAELAKETGGFPSAPNGGDLGFFERGMMVEPFNTVAFELEKDQVSDIVETEYGYHIIKVTDKKDAGLISFEEVKDQVIQYLSDQKKAESSNEYIDELISNATIEFPEGKEIKSGLFAP